MKDIHDTHKGHDDGPEASRTHQDNQSVIVGVGNENRISAAALIKKTKKIAAALVVVTSALKDNQILKTEIERVAVKLVKDVCELESAAITGSYDLSNITMSLNESLHFIDLLFFTKTISKENIELVKSLIAATITAAENCTYQEKSDLRALVSSPEDQEIVHTVSGVFDHNIQTAEIQHAVEPKESHIEHVSIVKKIAPTRQLSVHSAPNSTTPRRQQIVELLKVSTNPEGVQIKEIAARIPECSEKTIQRELAALVESGVLIRSGDRRWTTYRLSDTR